MLTCFMRSALMVNDEIPMSYFPLFTPVMIVAKSAVLPLGLDPELLARPR